MNTSLAVTTFRAVVLVSPMLLSACGGGGSPADPVEAVPATPRVIEGAVTKGPVVGATVKIFEQSGGAIPGGAVPLATATTDANGKFTVPTFTAPAGATIAIVEACGGSFVDESDPATPKRQIALTSGQCLESALVIGAPAVVVTPYSMALLQKARTDTAVLGIYSFETVLAAVQSQATQAFGFDPITTIPANPISPSGSAASMQYAMMLGGAANAINAIALGDGHVPGYADVIAFINDFSDGALDTSCPASGCVDLNAEIRRFKGNNGTAYQSVALATIDEATLAQTAPVPNQPPVAVDDALPTDEDVALTFAAADLALNDTDPENDPLTITAVSGATGGVVNLVSGTVTFTPTPNFSGTAGFQYTVTDGGNVDTGAVAITVSAVDDAPVAGDDAASTTEDVALTITEATLLANDTDVDSVSLSVLSVASLTGGTADLAAGVVTFTPDPEFVGPATFEYTLYDGFGTDTGLVTVTVGAVNDLPSITDFPGGSIAEDADTGSIDYTIGDTETLPEQLLFSAVSSNQLLVPDANISYADDGDGNAEFREITLTPLANAFGTTTITVTVTDGNGGTAIDTFDLTVDPVNDAPIALPDGPYTVVRGGSLTILPAAGVLLNDGDIDSAELVVGEFPSIGPETSSTVTFTGDGGFTYLHDGSAGAADTFSYEVCDVPAVPEAGFLCASAVVTVTVVDSPLLGTWAMVDPLDNVLTERTLTFFADGKYLYGGHDEDPNCSTDAGVDPSNGSDANGNGIEYGTYTWNTGTGEFATGVPFRETNGSCGFYSPSPGATNTSLLVLENGDTLNFDNGQVRFKRVPSELNAVKGAFLADGSLLAGEPAVIAFFPSAGDPNAGRYFMADANATLDPPYESAGIEDGCYVRNATTNVVTIDLSGTCPGAIDTNDEAGLSDAGSAEGLLRIYPIGEPKLQLIASDGAAQLTRLPLTAPDATTDYDGDGLTEAQEIALGTDANIADTDGDGLGDFAEVRGGADPFAEDAGVDTDPLDADSDGDGLPDGSDPAPLFNAVAGVWEAEIPGVPGLIVAIAPDGRFAKGGAENSAACTGPAGTEANGNGYEVGTWTYVDGVLEFTITRESDGDVCGLGTLGANAYTVVALGAASMTLDDGAGDVFTLHRIASQPGLVGAWGSDIAAVTPDEPVILIAKADNTYVLIDSNSGETCAGQPENGGIEYGTFTNSGSTYTFTAARTDTNGACGFSNAGNPVSRTLTFSGDQFNDATLGSYTRLVPLNALDPDADGLTDAQEASASTNPGIADSDADGLKDGTELSIGTDPNLADTDGDGASDFYEVSRDGNPYGYDPNGSDTDPNDPLDTPPLNPDTDDDGLWNAVDPAPDAAASFSGLGLPLRAGVYVGSEPGRLRRIEASSGIQMTADTDVLPLGAGGTYARFIGATIASGNVSNIQVARLMYAKAGALKILDLATSAPVTVSGIGACGIAEVAEDIKVPANSLALVNSAGGDGRCFTADDAQRIVRAEGTVVAGPFAPIEGMAALHSPDGALVGVLTLEVGTTAGTWTLTRRSTAFAATASALTLSSDFVQFVEYAFTKAYIGLQQGGVTKLYRFDMANGGLATALTELHTYAGAAGDGGTYDGDAFYFSDGTSMYKVRHSLNVSTFLRTFAGMSNIEDFSLTATRIVVEMRELGGQSVIKSVLKDGTGEAVIAPLTADAREYRIAHTDTAGDKVYLSKFEGIANTVTTNDVGSAPVEIVNSGWAGGVAVGGWNSLTDEDPPAILIRSEYTSGGGPTIKAVTPGTGNAITLGQLDPNHDWNNVRADGFGNYVSLSAIWYSAADGSPFPNVSSGDEDIYGADVAVADSLKPVAATADMDQWLFFEDMPDWDGDGLTNAQEAALGTNRTAQDTDGDGVSDFDEVDQDGNPNDYNPAGGDGDPLDSNSEPVIPPPPVAEDDAYAIGSTGTLSIPAPGLMANDTSASVAGLKVVNVSPRSGLTVNQDGSFSYSGASGSVSFTYDLSDAGNTNYGTAIVTINVTDRGAQQTPLFWYMPYHVGTDQGGGDYLVRSDNFNILATVAPTGTSVQPGSYGSRLVSKTYVTSGSGVLNEYLPDRLAFARGGELYYVGLRDIDSPGLPVKFSADDVVTPGQLCDPQVLPFNYGVPSAGPAPSRDAWYLYSLAGGNGQCDDGDSRWAARLEGGATAPLAVPQGLGGVIYDKDDAVTLRGFLSAEGGNLVFRNAMFGNPQNLLIGGVAGLETENDLGSILLIIKTTGGATELRVLPINTGGVPGTPSAPLHTVAAGSWIRDVITDSQNFYFAETNDAVGTQAGQIYRIPLGATAPTDVDLIYQAAGVFIDRFERTANKLVFTERADYNWNSPAAVKILSKTATEAPTFEAPVVVTNAHHGGLQMAVDRIYYSERLGTQVYEASAVDESYVSGAPPVNFASAIWAGEVFRDAGTLATGLEEDVSYLFLATGLTQYEGNGMYGATLKVVDASNPTGTPVTLAGPLTNTIDQGRYVSIYIDSPGIGLGEACAFVGNARECDIVAVDANPLAPRYQRITVAGPDEGTVEEDEANADRD